LATGIEKVGRIRNPLAATGWGGPTIILSRLASGGGGCAQCPVGKVNLWTRNENLCHMPAGCGGGGACAAYVPGCAEGYSLVSWVGGRFGCTLYACDPAFVDD
jgi:hypothetical protein